MKEVLVYYTRTCPFCIAAQRLLESKNIVYTGIDVGGQPERRREMIEKSKGAYTVPQIFIDGSLIGGCDELYALEESGELDILMKKS